MSNKRWRDRKREGERERSPCAYIFRKTVFHIAMRRSVAYSRGPRTSGPRDPRAFAGRRGRTRSNTVKRAYASLEGGKACVYVCAWPGHTRVESRSNRRKRGQTPWLTKEEANYMYIRVYLRGLVRLLSPWNRPSLLFKRPSFHPPLFGPLLYQIISVSLLRLLPSLPPPLPPPRFLQLRPSFLPSTLLLPSLRHSNGCSIVRDSRSPTHAPLQRVCTGAATLSYVHTYVGR